MVTGAEPQSKVMMPPFFTAASSAAKVQLAAVPVPTTVVGFEVSTGLPSAGTPVEHDPFGLPFGIEPLLEPPDPLLELGPVVEPVVVPWPLPPVPLVLPGPPLVVTPAPV